MPPPVLRAGLAGVAVRMPGGSVPPKTSVVHSYESRVGRLVSWLSTSDDDSCYSTGLLGKVILDPAARLQLHTSTKDDASTYLQVVTRVVRPHGDTEEPCFYGDNFEECEDHDDHAIRELAVGIRAVLTQNEIIIVRRRHCIDFSFF